MAAVRFPIGAFLVSPMAAISFSSVASNLPQGSLILFIALPGTVNFGPIGLLCPPPERWIVLIFGCGKLGAVLGASTVNMWRASDNGKLSPI